ncbi:MAG: hypothetical protein ACYDER_18625 [Ktedonobacteraceae bacterium]
MIVYVESNFILEIVLKQQQAASAEAVLHLAEMGKIEIAFPSFALSEPFATITRRERDQERLGKAIEGMLDQLPIMLTNASRKERDSLWSVISRLVAIGTSLETNKACLTQALAYQMSPGLTSQDSIIYAATILDLQQRPFGESKCFLNKNSYDFKVPSIITELNSYNCWYEHRFAQGLNFIRSSV